MPQPRESSWAWRSALSSWLPRTQSDPTSYVHDDDHRLVQVALPSGETIDVQRETGTHRVTSIATSEGAAILPSYDAVGRVSTLAGPYGDVALSFDYDGPRVTAQHWFGPTEGSVEVDYDGRGRVTAQTVEGVALGFGYDADGLLTSAGSLTLSRSATTGWVESVGVGGVTQTLVHDEYGEVAGSSYVQGGETLYGYALYGYALGRIVGETEEREGEAAVEWAYAYDARGRLEQVERDGLLYAAYEYDPNGNRTSVSTSEGSETGFADAQDRLAEFGQCEFGYDANGAMATRVCGVGQVWAYEYDALGLLRSVTLPDARVVSYAYDAGGRPVARYVDGVYTRGWLWGSALEPVAELDAEGEVEARYVYASRGHVPDLVIRAEGTYRLITDYRGSVVAVVHVGSGEVVETFEYGPWGEVVSHEGGRMQAFGYAGGLWDEDTGLVLFGARWYDAGLGRWLSKDPARFGGEQANLYLYVAADPIASIDVTGLRRIRDVIPYHLHPSVRPGVTFNNWIGVGLGAIAMVGGADLSVHDGQLYVNGGGNWNIVEALGLSSAFTMGGVVIVDGSVSLQSKTANYPHGSPPSHEWVHSVQGRILGSFYIPAVAVSWGAQAGGNLMAGKSFDDGTNIIEDWAERWAQ